MSYTIKFTNGKTLAVIADQTIDEVSSSVTLVGKNVNNYGQYINTNFVGLLENFAGLTEPRSPMTGQTWFDTAEGRLKVYSTGTFKPIGAPSVGTTSPTNPIRGDFWIDTVNGILKYWTGTAWQEAGKVYSDQTGKDGWFNDTIPNTLNEDIPVVTLYSKGVRAGVFTTSTIQTLSGVAYVGTNTLYPGLTLAPEYKIYGTVTYAESIGGINISSYLVKSDTSTQIMSGPLSIESDYDNYHEPTLSVGIDQNIQVYVDSGVSIIRAGTSSREEPFEIRYQSESDIEAVAFHINPITEYIGVKTNDPQDDFDVNGNVIVRGNLTVLGDQTNLEVSVIKVDDINIELGTNQDFPSDTTADGGGIILHGATDKKIVYSLTSTAWQSNIDLNLETDTLSYKIAGDSVVQGSEEYPGNYRLGDKVTSAPGLVHLPALAELTVTNVIIRDSEITTTDTPAKDLYLKSSSNLINLANVGKIVGLAPSQDTDPEDAAITKKYFEDKISLSLGGFVGRKPYTLSIDITDFGTIDEQIINYLDLTLPVNGYDDPYYAQPDGSRCSVLCSRSIPTTATYYLDNLNTSTIRTLLNYVENIEYTNNGTSTSYISTLTTATQLVVTDFELAGSITVSTPLPIIERSVRLYQVLGGYWTFVRVVNTEYLTSYSSVYVADIDQAVTKLTVTPTTSTSTVISLPDVTGINRGHRVTGAGINTLTNVVTVITGTNDVEVYPAMDSSLTAGTTVTFSYSPGAVIYMNASGPATATGTGTFVTVQDKTTQLNLLYGTLIDNQSTSSYLNTVTVGILINSTTIGSTGTYSNWLISLGGA